MKSCRSGFTFVELLVVIAVIAVLAAGVGVAVRRIPAQARVAAAKDQVGRLKLALEMYYSENGAFPTLEQGLDALCREPTSQPVPRSYPEGGYLDSIAVPLDPWGNDFAYFIPGREGKAYEIVSYGGDAQHGGDGEDADISSLEL